jgi:UDP-glucose 4-epimerase
MDHKHTLITGGAGFIGSHLVDRLIETGENVRVIDNLSTGRKTNLEDTWDRIEFIEGDLSQPRDINRALEGIDTIFHLAANTSVPGSIDDPRSDFKSNALGTFNLLEACRNHDVREITYASTAAVYGEPQYLPIDEGHPLNPISPYGASKLAGEKMGAVYQRVYNLTFTTIRIFNVYGPRQSRYVMHDLITKLSGNPEKLEVLGDGNQRRCYCYIDDAIDGILLASKEAAGDVINLSGDESISVNELAEIMIPQISPGAEIYNTGESWRGDIQTLVGDNSKLKDLGYQGRTPLREGIRRLLESYPSNGQTLTQP